MTTRSKRIKCTGSKLLIYPQPMEVMSMRATCPVCETPDLKIKSEMRGDRVIAKLPPHSQHDWTREPITADEAAAGIRMLGFAGPHDLTLEELRSLIGLLGKLEALAERGS